MAVANGVFPQYLNLDSVVSSAASEHRVAKVELQTVVDPDLEYAASTFNLSLYFHGSPDHVAQIRKHFQRKWFKTGQDDLATLSRTVLQDLTDWESPCARMDFHFHDNARDVDGVREFLSDRMSFCLPEAYETGDWVSLDSEWLFTLHSLGGAEDGLARDERQIFAQHGARWRLMFLRQRANNVIDRDLLGGAPRIVCGLRKTLESSSSGKGVVVAQADGFARERRRRAERRALKYDA